MTKGLGPGSGVRILVVDDDPGTRRLLGDLLRRAGFSVILADSGVNALQALGGTSVAMVILDLGLPDLDGMEVLRSLRGWVETLPVMVVSARGGEADKVLALRGGADDFLSKPFGSDEFVARVEALLRRANLAEPDEAPLRLADLTIDASAHEIRAEDGRSVRLTPTELGVLRELVRHPGAVRTHTEILAAVWGLQLTHEHGYVRTIVQRLRQKVEKDSANPQHIITVPGVGYLWK